MASFDALWKGFNHYYESLYVPSDEPDIRESDLMHRAVDRIPARRLASILRRAQESGIAEIPSVFNERISNRFGEKAIGRHEKVKRLLLSRPARTTYRRHPADR